MRWTIPLGLVFELRNGRWERVTTNVAAMKKALPLSVGDELGTYEIIGPIGAGGVGEDPDRRRRFEQEPAQWHHQLVPAADPGVSNPSVCDNSGGEFIRVPGDHAPTKRQ
jgi:hypothetical protein